VLRAAKPAQPAADICWDMPVAAKPDEASAAIAHTANEKGREGVGRQEKTAHRTQSL